VFEQVVRKKYFSKTAKRHVPTLVCSAKTMGGPTPRDAQNLAIPDRNGNLGDCKLIAGRQCSGCYDDSAIGNGSCGNGFTSEEYVEDANHNAEAAVQNIGKLENSGVR